MAIMMRVTPSGTARWATTMTMTLIRSTLVVVYETKAVRRLIWMWFIKP